MQKDAKFEHAYLTFATMVETLPNQNFVIVNKIKFIVLKYKNNYRKSVTCA